MLLHHLGRGRRVGLVREVPIWTCRDNVMYPETRTDCDLNLDVVTGTNVRVAVHLPRYLDRTLVSIPCVFSIRMDSFLTVG